MAYNVTQRESKNRRGVGPFLRLTAEAVRTLQFKATAVVVVLTLSVTTAVAAYLLQGSIQIARQQHGEQILISASLLAKAAAPLLAAGNHDSLLRLAAESANGLPLLYVIVSDPSGNELAAARHRSARSLRQVADQSGLRSVPGLPVLHANDGDVPVYLDVIYPITWRQESRSGAAPQLLGYVRAGMVANNWHKALASRVDLVIGVGALSLLAALPLGFLLVRRIVGPLEDLGQAMISFAHGKLDVRSPIRRRDELGRLAAAFNQMADQHQQTHLRIVRLNAELEERVAYRTHQLRELASRDALTGLHNRRYFGEVLGRCFAEAIRYRTNLSCIMIDIDDFKKANDAYGHQVGDQLLQLAAGTILGQLRTADVAARYGGDEFVLLLPQTDAERAEILGGRIAERFRSELAERFPQCKVGMSMGVSSLNCLESSDAESLIRAADRALYEAKSRGKNRIVMAVPAA